MFSNVFCFDGLKSSRTHMQGHVGCLNAFCGQLGLFDALRRLEKLAQSEGPGAQAESLAILLERLVRGLERGGKSWTVARKKDGLQRVLETNRSDFQRLLARHHNLLH